MIPLEQDGAPAPGIYPGTDFNEYASWPAVNASTLVEYARSAAHGRYAELHPEKGTKEMELGTLAHMAILEPDRFSSRVVPNPIPGPHRTNVKKQAVTNFVREQEALGNVVADTDSIATAIRMREAVYSHRTAAEILSATGLREVSIVWIDPEWQVKCKARYDLFGKWMKNNVIVDLKGIQDARSKPVQNQIARFSYALKAAWYRRGASALNPMDRYCILIFVEFEEPHGVAVYQLDDATLDRGETEISICLDRYLKGKQTGVWPGYDGGVGLVEVPKWARSIAEET